MKKMPIDIIILNMCTINDNHMMYDSWDMECKRQNFFSLWIIFCPFTPLTTQKIKILKKWKKTPGDIILHKRTKSHNQMLYSSWDMVCNRCNCCFSFWVIFCPFTSLTAPKIKFKKKKEKNTQRYHHFTMVYIILRKCTKNHYHMLYCSWDTVHDRCNCYLSFCATFCPFTALRAQNIKIFKK